jgi:hypothetical protein
LQEKTLFVFFLDRDRQSDGPACIPLLDKFLPIELKITILNEVIFITVDEDRITYKDINVKQYRKPANNSMNKGN